MNVFTIKDLENLSGIKAHTIRIWEQRYAFLKPHRTETNIRYYTSDELKLILNIALLNRHGFKISHINNMSEGEINQKIAALSQSHAQLEIIVNEMLGKMMDLDMNGFEKVIDNQIRLKGTDYAILHVLFPFLEKIGVLWQTGNIIPVQEHLASNIIRQKILLGIDKLPPVESKRPLFILFLPENEYHELGLLYVYYLLKSRNIPVLYLGANIPVADLDYIIKSTQPDVAYLHLTSSPLNFDFEKYLGQLNQYMGQMDIVISGFLTRTYEKKLPSNVIFKKSLSEVNQYIESKSPGSA